MTPELEQLLTRLAGLRTSVVKKLAGLSDDDARRSVDIIREQIDGQTGR